MNPQNFLRILVFLLLSNFALFGALSTAEATTVAVLNDAQLVEFSDAIALVTVESTQAFWFDDHTMITKVHATVQETYKGAESAEIDFYVRGGNIGDLVQTVEGEYQPIPGETLVVFLEKIPRYHDLPMLLGLSQGAFVVDDIPMTRSDRQIPVRIHRSAFVPCRSDSALCRAATLDDLRKAIAHQGDQ